MDLSIVQWETDAVPSALVATAVVGTLWYLLRVLAALVLVVASRWRPGAGGAALRWAPAPLRPLIGRAVLGGLLVAGLAGPAAAADDGCSEASPMPILDRGDRCAAAAEAGAADRARHTTSRTPAVVVRGLRHLVTADDGPGSAAQIRPESEDLFR